ncbi:hypothetical protein K1T71_000134 [Dendrolimus kikuchii]|uniref:Uncharacterized protein n=1 Tax=Dendrolimus kikuchii TaxID=765133 RepID=A0ACC1DIQ8_9NEOP|nr:hypothetical protein K1T71_000134 [Dendrolimus kikuchii]
MKILPLIALLVCMACQSYAQDDAEGRSAPARGLLKRNLLPRGKQTTTTTTPAPQEDGDYEDEEDYPAEGESPEPSTEAPAPSSTEPAKKLVAGGVRPFRSNTDLLETLKRRRAQVAEAKHRSPSNSESAAPQESPAESAKASFSKKRFNNVAARDQAASNNEEVSAPAPKPSRGRFGRPATRSVDPEADTENDAAPPVRSSRYSRRGGN